MNRNSKTNLDRFDAMTDEMIDVSDIPPLTDEFFASAKWRMPKNKVRVVVELEPEIVEWYKLHGEHFQDVLAVALRSYAEAHKRD